MSDLHIDDFYRDTAKILTTLYGHFPRAITLYVEDISGQDTPDEFGLHSPRHESCFHTMLWLGSTGYLNHGACVRQEGVDATVLSHQAFLLLNSATVCNSNQVPPSQAPSATRGELVIHKMRDELTKGTSDSLAEFMRITMDNFNQS